MNRHTSPTCTFIVVVFVLQDDQNTNKPAQAAQRYLQTAAKRVSAVLQIAPRSDGGTVIHNSQEARTSSSFILSFSFLL